MKIKIILLIAAVVAVLVGVGWFCNEEGPPQNELTLHGNVDIRQVELAFNASGRIVQVLAQEGTRVKAGQLLASLDTGRPTAVYLHNVETHQLGGHLVADP